MLGCCTEMPHALPMREGRARLRPTLCKADFRKNLHSEEISMRPHARLWAAETLRRLDDGGPWEFRRKAE